MKKNVIKLTVFVLSTLSLSSYGSNKCALEAKLHARLHVASENKVSVGRVKAPESFYHSTSNKIHYHGVRVVFDGFSQSFNVGLKDGSCKLVQINQVTQ